MESDGISRRNVCTSNCGKIVNNSDQPPHPQKKNDEEIGSGKSERYISFFFKKVRTHDSMQLLKAGGRGSTYGMGSIFGTPYESTIENGELRTSVRFHLRTKKRFFVFMFSFSLSCHESESSAYISIRQNGRFRKSSMTHTKNVTSFSIY